MAENKDTEKTEKKDAKPKAEAKPKPEGKSKREKGSLPNSLKIAGEGELKISPDVIRMKQLYQKTVVPALITSAVPIDAIKGNSLHMLLFSAGVTLFWMYITHRAYKFSVKRYESGNLLR